MRFGLHKKANEIAHLVQCLKDNIWMIADQLSSGTMERDKFPEFDQYQQFINGLRNGKAINNIRIEIDGAVTPVEFTQPLPLHLINNALSYYISNFKEEIENDIVKSRITRVPGEAIYQLNREKQLQLPWERFVVRFVGSMYKFLLNEFPPAEDDYRPSDNYYLIIAHLLLQTWYFRSQPKSENLAVEQVRGWHKLHSNNA